MTITLIRFVFSEGFAGSNIPDGSTYCCIRRWYSHTQIFLALYLPCVQVWRDSCYVRSTVYRFETWHVNVSLFARVYARPVISWIEANDEEYTLNTKNPNRVMKSIHFQLILLKLLSLRGILLPCVPQSSDSRVPPFKTYTGNANARYTGSDGLVIILWGLMCFWRMR